MGRYKIEDIKNTILCGDALSVLKKFPDECIDMIITSPPYYSLRRYGDYKEQIGLEDTFEAYLDKIMAIMKEIKRVVKKEGQIWINMGDAFGTHNSGGKGHAHNFKKEDIGQCWNKPKQSLLEKCLLMMPERFAIKCCDELGLILRNKIVWAKQILVKKENRTIGSVMPTSVKDRFNESWEYLYFFVKSKKYYSDLDAVRLPPSEWTAVKGYTNQMDYQRDVRKNKNYDLNGTLRGQQWADKGYKNWDFKENRPYGIIRQKDYLESKYSKFN